MTDEVRILLIPAAPAKTRILRNIKPDKQLHLVFKEGFMTSTHCFHAFEPGALGVVVVPRMTRFIWIFRRSSYRVFGFSVETAVAGVLVLCW